MKSLTIARNGFSLPLDAVTTTVGVLGIRGSGKTHTASVITEEMLEAGMQVIVLDPLDAWYGLRTSADGKGPGYPVTVLGGEHADIPLEASSGHIVAEFAVEHGVSLVLSLRHFSKTDQRRFVAEFCERLYRLKGKSENRQPVHIVIDEADEVAPQRLGKGSERCFGAVDTIVRRGRSSGIGVTLISQRPAAVNKDVLTQIELLVCHRIIGPQDRKAIGIWLEGHPVGETADNAIDSLAVLKPGECWLWSPAWLDAFERLTIRKRKTFDSSATPKIGARVVAPSGRAEVDLMALQERMSETISKAEADDPKILRRRIAELEKQIKSGAGDHSECEARERTLQTNLESVRDVSKRNLDKLWADFQEVKDKIDRIGAICSEDYKTRPVERPTFPEHMITPSGEAALPKRITGSFKPPVAQLPRRTIPANDNGSSLPKGEHAILSACIQHGSCTRSQLSVLTTYKRSTRDRIIQYLQQKGYVEVSGGCISATDEGRRALPDYEELPTGDALRQHWVMKLPEGQAAILKVLISAYPGSVSRETISTATDYARSTRDRLIQYLQARQLVERVGQSEVRASAVLFD